MRNFEKIAEEMERRGIVPRIHYELVAIRWFKRGVVALVVAGIVWLIWK